MIVAAVGAVPVEFVPVPKNPKSIAVRNLILGFLDHLALEFDDRTALQADEMIVVFVFQFVAHDAIIEVPLLCKTGFDEELHGAIHRRVPDAGMILPNPAVDLFARRVALGRQKHIENRIPLARMFEALLLQKTGESVLFDFVGHRRRA